MRPKPGLDRVCRPLNSVQTKGTDEARGSSEGSLVSKLAAGE